VADLISDVKSKLSTTSMSDVVDAGARGLRSMERGLQSGLAKGKKFLSDHTPDSVKELYRSERGYTVKPRSQTRKR
jgi:hypothetical protein